MSIKGVGDVRSQGLMGGVEVVADKATKQLHPPEAQMTQRLTDALFDHGVCTRVALDCICLAPPLVIEEAQLDQLTDRVGEAISSVLS